VAENQCSVLFVQDGCDTLAAGLRLLGFSVIVSAELPDAIGSYHAVVVCAGPDCSLTMLATRVRAKPLFGRRVLIALVHPATPERTKREAVLSGFDATLSSSCSVRDLAATILKRLRLYPEFRCVLRAPGGRRKAA
jgi:hypothetical protein